MEFNSKYWDQSLKEEKPKQVLYRSAGKGYCFAIFRLDRKFKQLEQIKGFQKHMQREMEVPNADRSRTSENRILIGGPNIYDDVMEYLSGCKLRVNSVLARDILLTASPEFFKGISPQEKELWIEKNVKFLKDSFGDNVRYAVLHKDERTWHIHALVVPKFRDRNRTFLAHSRYFDGPEKLRHWQDVYSQDMQQTFKVLNRGIRFSKAKHVTVRHFYGMLDNVKSIENKEEIFKSNILLSAKLKGLEATLTAYRDMLQDKDKNIEELKKITLDLKKQVKDMKKDRDMYKDVVKQLSQTYKLPQNAVEKTLNYIKSELEIKK